jgi:hypothetical protein
VIKREDKKLIISAFPPKALNKIINWQVFWLIRPPDSLPVPIHRNSGGDVRKLPNRARDHSYGDSAGFTPASLFIPIFTSGNQFATKVGESVDSQQIL